MVGGLRCDGRTRNERSDSSGVRDNARNNSYAIRRSESRSRKSNKVLRMSDENDKAVAACSGETLDRNAIVGNSKGCANRDKTIPKLLEGLLKYKIEEPEVGCCAQLGRE